MNMKSYLEQYSHTALAMNDIEILLNTYVW